MLKLKLNKTTALVFDLDDTLYKEIDFLKSGFKAILTKAGQPDNNELFSQMLVWYFSKKNVFEKLVKTDRKWPLDKHEMLEIYRFHKPRIALDQNTRLFLDTIKKLGFKTSLITDGRSVTQRNKIKALGLNNYFNKLVISEEIGTEKPSPENYLMIEQYFGKGTFYYFGDNIKKDFFAPNKLNWQTVLIENQGANIHANDKEEIAKSYWPKFCVKDFSEIVLLDSL